MAPTAQADSRRRNLGAALRALHARGPIRQTELADTLHVNRSTGASLVEELAALGLVREIEADSSGRRGRPSPLIATADDVVAIAAELSADRARVELVQLGGTILARAELGVTPASLGPTRTIRRLVDAVAALIDEHHPVRVVGAALAIHGAVDRGGRMHFAPNLGWNDIGHVDRVLAEHLAGPALPPVIVGNEATIGALGELRRGAGRARRDFVYLAAERGIGAGIVVDGTVIGGATGLAGEVGHIKVGRSTARCGCGQRGCWEAEIGQYVLEEKAGLGSLHEVFTRAGAGARAPRRAVASAATWLGRGLGTIVAMLQPQAIVLGGHLAPVYELCRDEVHEALAGACPPPLLSGLEIAPSALGREAAIVGAAELVFDDLFANPAGTDLGALERTPA